MGSRVISSKKTHDPSSHIPWDQSGPPITVGTEFFSFEQAVVISKRKIPTKRERFISIGEERAYTESFQNHPMFI